MEKLTVLQEKSHTLLTSISTAILFYYNSNAQGVYTDIG